MPFDSLAFDTLLFFDGAMGSMLARAGLKPGECPEIWNIENPRAVRAIHEAYVQAGSDIVETNTLGANAHKLAMFGLGERVVKINRAAVRLARDSGAKYAAASIGPTGAFLAPYGDMTFEELHAIYLQQARTLFSAGADILFIETMMDLSEARVAMLAAKEAGAPFIPSFTFQGNQMTLMGNTPEALAACAQSLGAAALGINCSGGPGELLPVLKRMRAACSLPIVVQPNAGIPAVVDGQTVFPLGAREMAPMMREIALSGASAIGGCCGTTPEHIREMIEATRDIDILPLPRAPEAAVTSTRAVVTLEDARSALFVMAVHDSMDALDALMDTPDGCRAVLLDIGDMAIEAIGEFVAQAQQYCRLPLLFKASNDDAAMAALQAYVGISAIDCAQLDEATLRHFGAWRL